MTRFATLIAITAVTISNMGCVVAVGNKGTFSNPRHLQAVELDNDIYIVNVKTNEVRKIPREKIENAEVAHEHAD